MSRAFDCGDWEILLVKLSAYAVVEAALRWIKSFLNKHKQYVSIVNINSNIKSTVPSEYADIRHGCSDRVYNWADSFSSLH